MTMLVLSRRKAIALMAAPAAAAALPAFAQTPAPQTVNGKLGLLLVNDIYKMSEEKGAGWFRAPLGHRQSGTSEGHAADLRPRRRCIFAFIDVRI